MGSTKGGVGKTALALNLAIARALAGRDVWLIDCDRQGTAQTAVTIRAENGCCQPTVAWWALADISALVEDARSVRDGLRAFAVLNCADPAGADDREALEALAGFPQLEFLGVQIGRRKGVATAAGAGWLESTPDHAYLVISGIRSTARCLLLHIRRGSDGSAR